jgi:antitoxin component of RelBE/YafQ-DinJ toxin-antitoxin module
MRVAGPNGPKTVLSIRVEETVKAALQELAERQDLTVSQVAETVLKLALLSSGLISPLH